MSEKLLNYKLTEAKAELVKGEHSQSAIVNQEAKENITNTITVDEVKGIAKKENEELPESVKTIIKELIESLGGTSLKDGSYLYNYDLGKFVCFEEVPEDYTGLAIEFFDDGFYVSYYDNGVNTLYSYLSTIGISVNDENSNTNITPNGVDKLDFASLTHSFNELDPTIKQIVEDAIADADTNGVACTQAQWNEIKSLLDKSLYLQYGSYSLIKSYFNGIDKYVFGEYGGDDSGFKFSILWTENLLYIVYEEA